MTLNVNHKVGMLAATAGVFLAIFVGVVYSKFHTLRAVTEQVHVVFQARGNHQSADMMHDALRGDVLNALLLAGKKDAAGLAAALEETREHIHEFRRCVKENQELPLPAVLHTALTDAAEAFQPYAAKAETLVGHAADDLAAAERDLPAFNDAFSALETSMGQVTELLDQEATRIDAAAAASVAQFQKLLLGGAFAALGTLAVVAVLVARSIPRPFARIIAGLNQVSESNFTGARHVSSASESLASGAAEQAASLEEVSATLEELSGMTRRNAASARTGKDAAAVARQAVAASEEDMRRMQETMSALQRSSQDTTKIVKTIDEIAFQTAILALNAAVEAARAGEAGAGFAIVADEVRALARRSAVAAKETAEKIDEASRHGSQGADYTQRVAQGLAQISARVREVDDLIAEVATASAEQSTGIAQIATTLVEMEKVTQANAARAEETASAAVELSTRSEELREDTLRLTRLVGGIAAAD